MKKSLQLLSALTAMLLAMAALSGCGGGGDTEESAASSGDSSSEAALENFNPTGMPIVNEPVTLEVFCGKHPLQVDYDEMPMWDEYEKLTGVHIEWDLVDQGSMTERKNILLNSGDYPDVFFKQGLSQSDLVNYGPDQQVFIPLDDLIEEYGENFKNVLADYPEIENAIRLYDGHIYSLPNIAGMETSVGCFYFINQAWMDAVGQDMPTNLDEYRTLLEAFRDEDPNGNGQKDEIPMLSSWYGLNGFIHYLKGSWGLGKRGSFNMYVDCDEETDTVRFTATVPEFREVVEYVRGLYQDGLLNQEIFTIDDITVTAKGEEGVAGSFIFQNPIQIGKTHQDDYVIVTEPMRARDDIEPINTLVGPNVQSKTSFVITKECEYPEVAFRWGEYFYSEEGQALFWMGVEGLTYTINENGEYIPTDLILNNPDGLTVDEATGKYFPRFMGGPTIKNYKYAYGHGDTLPILMDAVEVMRPYKPKEIWSSFNYDIDQQTELNALSTDIITYYDEMIAQFVSGKIPMSEWDSFLAELDKMGLDRYLEIWNEGYQNYKSKQ